MNILDICIIVFLVIGGLLGFKAGFTRSLVNLVGYIIIVVVAFILKNPISEFMMLHLPFFDFYGTIKGVSVLNIAIYEILAFTLVFSILLILLKVLMLATTIFEKILSFTIILGLPSKILGCMLGIVKNYIIVFVILFILCFSNFSDKAFIKESTFKDPILEKTPVLSLFTEKSIKVFNEFTALKGKYKNIEDSNKFNYETLELYLKYDIVKASLIQKLVERDKLHIKKVEELIKKYGD